LNRKLFDSIFEPGALTVRFEPVFDVSRKASEIHYLECLIRGPKGTPLEAPDRMFAEARENRRTGELDRACITSIMKAAQPLPSEAPIAINVHASTLALDADMPAFVDRLASANGIASSRLVLEVVEHEPPWDIARFREALEALRSRGVRIALDDIGLGHSNYRMILECRPDYFKVDRYFVAGCHDDVYRQAVLRSVVQLGPPFGAKVVAEGVERCDDLTTLKMLGIDLVQGWLLGRPLSEEQGRALRWPERAVRNVA